MELVLSDFSHAEVLQYLGWRGSDIPTDVDKQIQVCMTDTLRIVQPRFTYRVLDLVRQEDQIMLKGTEIPLPGKDLAALLQDCKQCVLMAATLGMPLEAAIHRAEIADMTRAMILDCCGSSAIEAVCGQVEQIILQQLSGTIYPTGRFSPGYGDMPLAFQKQMVALLDTARQIGLSMTESYILTPRKSVTAIFGLAHKPQTKRFRGCAYCSMFVNCTFRKAGKTCGR